MSSNKTIAKNTLFLYVRMLFNMGVSLYTSRVVLQVLGVEDFGIYNLVGGVVTLFSFINNTMSAATQRFINVEKASGNITSINKVFNLSLINHVAIALVILLLAETIGLWFLNDKLNIPDGRMYAANVVYQISIFTTLLGISNVPFNAMILSHERMSYFAYVGMAETLMKLLIVFVLMWSNEVDSLILYSILFLFVSVLSQSAMIIYCKKQFRDLTRFKFYRDRKKVTELLSFSGWVFFGQLAVVAAGQGMGMVLNVFHGVVVNAALGVAGQVNNTVYSFVSNFQIAFQPQIIQSYASNEYQRHKQMVLSTSKYSFFMMALLSAPILYLTHNLLTFWLGKNIPMYTEDFIRMVMIFSLIDALSGPFWMSAMAKGGIKRYNVVIAMINLLTLPIAFVVIKMGYSPVYAYATKLFTAILMQLFRYYFVNSYLKFGRKELGQYILSILIIGLFLGILIIASDRQDVAYSFLGTISASLVIFALLTALIIIVGLNTNERTFLFGYLKNKYRIF